MVGLALLFLLTAAGSTLASPLALHALIIQGIAASLQGQALAVFSALRCYTITWLGERITGHLRPAVYAHVLRQGSVLCNMSPQIEQHVDWITPCIGYLRAQGVATIEDSEAAA